MATMQQGSANQLAHHLYLLDKAPEFHLLKVK